MDRPATSNFRNRPTADLIVLALTAVVGLILLAMTVTIVVVEIWYPDHDIGSIAQRVGTLTSSLIGAIIGYLAGRGVRNGNGNGL